MRMPVLRYTMYINKNIYYKIFIRIFFFRSRPLKCMYTNIKDNKL